MAKHFEARVTIHGLCQRIADERDEITDEAPWDVEGFDAWITDLSRSVAVASADARRWLDTVLFSFADNYGGECPDAVGAPVGPCAPCGADDTRGRYDHASLDLDRALAVAVADMSERAPTGWLGALLPSARLRRPLALRGALRAA
jgi:hypothetical protein